MGELLAQGDKLFALLAQRNAWMHNGSSVWKQKYNPRILNETDGTRKYFTK